MGQWDPEIRACVGSPQALCFSSPRVTPSADQLLPQLGAGAGEAQERRELREVVGVFNPWLLAQLKTNLICCFCLSFPTLRAHIILPSEPRLQMYKRFPPNDVCRVWDTPGLLPGQELEGCLLLKGDWTGLSAPWASSLCSEDGSGGILQELSPITPALCHSPTSHPGASLPHTGPEQRHAGGNGADQD